MLRVWQVSAKHDGTANEQFQLVANGEVLGRYGEMVDPDSPTDGSGTPRFIADQDFNFVYQAIGDGAAQSPSHYTVVQGDTLRSIAKATLGDASLWPLIAEANGIADDAGLQAGQVLRIPGIVRGGTNNDGSGSLYDAGQAMGSPLPYLPQPARDKKNSEKLFQGFDPFNGRSIGGHIGDVGRLLTNPTNQNNWEAVYNSQPRAELIQAVVKAGALPNLRNIGNAFHNMPFQAYIDQEVAESPTLYAVGKTAVSVVVGMFTYGWGAGFAAATWDAYYGWYNTGSVSKGLKAGAPGAVGALVTMGMNLAPVANAAVGTAAATTVSTTQVVATAMASNAASQVVSIGLGMQESFDWRSVAAAGVTTFLGREFLPPSGGISAADIAQNFFQNTALNLVGSAIRGDSFSEMDWGRVAIDAVGSTASQWFSAKSQQAAAAERLQAQSPGLQISAWPDPTDPNTRIGANYSILKNWLDGPDSPSSRNALYRPGEDTGLFSSAADFGDNGDFTLQEVRHLGKPEIAALLKNYPHFLGQKLSSTLFNASGQEVSEIIRGNMALDGLPTDNEAVANRALGVLAMAAKSNVSESFNRSISPSVSVAGNFAFTQEYMLAKMYLNGLATQLGGTFDEGGRTYNYFGNRGGDWSDDRLLSGNMNVPAYKTFYDSFIYPSSTVGQRIKDNAVPLATAVLTLALGSGMRVPLPRLTTNNLTAMRSALSDAMLAEANFLGQPAHLRPGFVGPVKPENIGNAANSSGAGSLAARLERVAARTPEEVADRARVAELIYKARAQDDPGVPQLISQLEKSGVKVKDTNHYLGSPSREMDIETESGTILQVKKLSSAHKIINQVQDTERATGQPTIGYVLEQHQKANSIVQQAGRHVQVTNKFDVLLNWLRGE